MRVTGMKLLAAGALTLSLAACVPGEFPMTTTVSPLPPLPRPARPALCPMPMPHRPTTFCHLALPVEQIPTQYQRQAVSYPSNQVPGTIVINPAEKVFLLRHGAEFGDPLWHCRGSRRV